MLAYITGSYWPIASEHETLIAQHQSLANTKDYPPTPNTDSTRAHQKAPGCCYTSVDIAQKQTQITHWKKHHKAVVPKCGDPILRFELWTQCCFGSVERMPDYDMETGMKMVEEQVFKWAPLSCHSLGSPPPFSKENNNDRILKNLFESPTSENKTVHKLLAFSGKRWNNFQPFGLQELQRIVVWGFYENLS